MEHIETLPRRTVLCYERREHAFPFQWHYHPELELTCILEGSGERLVGDSVERYGPGDLVLLGPDLPHTWAGDAAGPHAAVVVQWTGGALLDATATWPEAERMRDLLGRAGDGLCLRDGQQASPIIDLMRATVEQSGLQQWASLLKLLDRLATCPFRPLVSRGYHPTTLDRRQPQRLNRLFQMLQARCDEPLRLEEAAACVHLSPAAFCRFFKRHTGQTFVHYRNGLRIAGAARRLVESDQSVACIAFSSGFSNLANFNRWFKRIKAMTPRAYRMAYRQGSATSPPL